MWVGDESPVRSWGCRRSSPNSEPLRHCSTCQLFAGKNVRRCGVEWQKSKSDTRRAPMKWSRLARLCRAFSIPKSQYWFPMRYGIPSPFFHFLLLNNYKILPGRFNIHAVEVERGEKASTGESFHAIMKWTSRVRCLSSTAAILFSLPGERKRTPFTQSISIPTAVHLCLSLSYIGRKCWRCFSTFIISKREDILDGGGRRS